MKINNKKIVYAALTVGVIAGLWGCSTDASDKVVTSTEYSTSEKDSTTTKAAVQVDAEVNSETETSAQIIGEDENEYEEYLGFKIKKLNETMQTTLGVNVRSGPGVSYDRLGLIEEDELVKVTGQCVENGWYRVEYQGETGFVIDDYLVATENYTNLILGDECPYALLIKTSYNGQCGWFYSMKGEKYPENYEELVEEISQEGYIYKQNPVYIGGWRDVGEVMWLGYSKQ